MTIKELQNEKFFKEFEVHVPFEEINSKVEESVSKAAKTFKMPGFREGKVPLSIVRQKVGKEETGKQIQEKISESIKNLIDSKKIIPYSKPDVQVLSFDEDKGLSIKIGFEILPEVPEVKWDSIEVEKINIKISNDEITQTKNNLLKEFRKYKKAESNYKTKVGDKVKINFHGQIEGKDFDGNKADAMELVIGDNTFLADFESNLVGCKLNDEKSFDIVFPKDYPKEDIANKKAVFKVKIVDVQELALIDKVSDEMLKKLGVESEEMLNELIKQKLNFDFMNSIRLKMKKELFDEVDKKYDFDLPNKMIEQDFEVIWGEVEKNKQKQENTKGKSDEELKSEYKQIAKRRVKLGLIMAEVTRQNNISITDDELRKIVELQANQNPQIKDKILEFYKNPENLEKIKGPILEEKALDFILSKVKLKEIEMTTDDFVKKVLPKIKDK